MDALDEKNIVNKILKQRRLSYSLELTDIQGDKYTVRNNFGTIITYVRKGDNYFLEEDLK